MATMAVGAGSAGRARRSRRPAGRRYTATDSSPPPWRCAGGGHRQGRDVIGGLEEGVGVGLSTGFCAGISAATSNRGQLPQQTGRRNVHRGRVSGERAARFVAGIAFVVVVADATVMAGLPSALVAATWSSPGGGLPSVAERKRLPVRKTCTSCCASCAATCGLAGLHVTKGGPEERYTRRRRPAS